MSRGAKVDALLAELEKSLQSSGSGQKARPGVEPHQRLLGALDLAPVVPQKVGDEINELFAVRNQLLHHGGRIDAKFLQLCPQFRTPQRRRLTVNADTFYPYLSAASDYVDVVSTHASAIAGLTPGEDAG